MIVSAKGSQDWSVYLLVDAVAHNKDLKRNSRKLWKSNKANNSLIIKQDNRGQLSPLCMLSVTLFTICAHMYCRFHYEVQQNAANFKTSTIPYLVTRNVALTSVETGRLLL